MHKIYSIIQNRSRLTPLDGDPVGTTVGLEEGETDGPFDGDAEGPFVIGRSVGLVEGCVEMCFGYESEILKNKYIARLDIHII